MARLYSDEEFPRPVSEKLRTMGHDVATCQECKQDNKKIPDEQVLAFATQQRRAVLTRNRRHFLRLHQKSSNHCGIVICTNNTSFDDLARCIHEKLGTYPSLDGQLVRVYRPG